MQTNTRMMTIDIARGIGIIFVVIGHLVFFNGFAFRWIFSFHMPLFFFMSGYCSGKSMSDKKFIAYSLGKFKSFIIPSWIFINLLNMLGMGVDSYMLSMKENIFQYIVPAREWFLTSLFVSSILLWLFVKAERRISNTRVQMLVSILIFIVAVGLALLTRLTAMKDLLPPDYSSYIPFRIGPSLLGFSYQLIGYRVRYNLPESWRLRNLVWDKPRILILLAAGIILVIYTGFNSYVNVADTGFGANIVMFYLAALFWIAIILKISSIIETAHNRFTQFFVFLGQNSLYIYLGHLILFDWFNRIVLKVWAVSWRPMYTFTVYGEFIYFVLALTILIPLLLVRQRLLVRIKSYKLRHEH